jgi:hypothetical protein
MRLLTIGRAENLRGIGVRVDYGDESFTIVPAFTWRLLL